ncbi:hypothetical protein HDV00_008263, partial [Rhizophlyctis rosea]
VAGLSFLAASIFALTFFNRARVARVMTILGIFIGAMIGLGISRTAPNPHLRGWTTAIIPGSGFVYSMVIMIRAEELGTSSGIGHWYDINASQGLSFGATLGATFVNFVLLAVLTWYVQQIMPQEYGTPKPWNFIFRRSAHDVISAGGDLNLTTPEKADILYEPVRGNVDPAVVIRNLTKQYAKAPIRSVDGLSFNLYHGQVLSLLEKNGCGKTSMHHTRNRSTAKAYGYSITTQMDSIRQVLGVCPQHDILWDNLTVRQTLRIYAALKSVPSSNIEEEVTNWIVKVGLEEEKDSRISTLSGGQKRRVSVCIAFLGGSKLVFLDEPSAGVDPYNRRALWKIILDNKAGRTIILTTHSLDEADLLGDRIAVMYAGRLRALGTSLFLKSNLGFGYNFTAVFANEPTDVEPVLSAVRRFVPEAKLRSIAKHEIVLRLPLSANSQLPDLLRWMETNRSALGISSVGVSGVSLQDMFMHIIEMEGDANMGFSEDNENGLPQKTRRINVGQPADEESIRPGNPTFVGKQIALIRKRFILAWKDWKLSLTPLLIMVIASIVVAIVGKNQSIIPCSSQQIATTPPTDLTARYLMPTNPAQQYLTSTTSTPFISAGLSTPIQFSITPALALALISQTPKTILGGYLQNDSTTTHAWPSFTALYDSINPYASAMGMNLIHNALYTTTPNAAKNPHPLIHASITTFPRFQNIVDSVDWTPSLIILFIILFANMLLIPIASTTPLIRERALRAKQQQRFAGVGGVEYWLANFLWDATYVVLCEVILAAAVSGGVKSWSAGWGATFVVFALYGVATTLLGYVFTFLFTSTAAGLAGVVGYLLLICIGKTIFPFLLLLSAHLFALPLTPTSHRSQTGFLIAEINQLGAGSYDIINILTYAAYAINPAMTLLQSCMIMSNTLLMQCASNPTLSTSNLFSWDLLLRAVVFLILQIILLAAVLVLIENWEAMELWWMSRRVLKVDLEESLKGMDVDPDVGAEERRVIASGQNDDQVVLLGLRRVFGNGAKVAVKNLSFGVGRNECFCLLGTNGAGKTTALKIVCGQELPIAGQVSVNQHLLLQDLAGVRRSIGHLDLFAALKGFPSSRRQEVINELIDRLDLAPHADKASADLSGGNRRKLSLAIALVGYPPVLILDEPSTGMVEEAENVAQESW